MSCTLHDCTSLPTDLASPDDIQSIDSLHMDLSALRVATDGFAMHNRLGEGGFGVVYKVGIITCVGFC